MTNVYVGNLPHSTTETELRNLFVPHGTVEDVSIITDRETGSRGFAFVEMADWGEAEKAIAALNGSELGGRALKINEAKPKTDRPRSNGGHRFGRAAGGAAEEEVAMIIVAMLANRASLVSRYGSSLQRRLSLERSEHRTRGMRCQEAVPHSTSAKKSKGGIRNNVTRLSAEISGNRKSPRPA